MESGFKVTSYTPKTLPLRGFKQGRGDGSSIIGYVGCIIAAPGNGVETFTDEGEVTVKVHGETVAVILLKESSSADTVKAHVQDTMAAKRMGQSVESLTEVAAFDMAALFAAQRTALIEGIATALLPGFLASEPGGFFVKDGKLLKVEGAPKGAVKIEGAEYGPDTDQGKAYKAAGTKAIEAATARAKATSPGLF